MEVQALFEIHKNQERNKRCLLNENLQILFWTFLSGSYVQLGQLLKLPSTAQHFSCI